MQNEADKILRLIEGVDPADTETLDQIDARFWCLLRNYEYMYNGEPDYHMFKFTTDNKSVGIGATEITGQYTRSLDAIKAVEEAELEGWRNRGDGLVCSGHFSDGHYYALVPKLATSEEIAKNDVPVIKATQLPTEHLARLHAATQALKWKRENDDKDK